MVMGAGRVLRIFLEGDERERAEIACLPELIPAPGQYLLAYPSDGTGHDLPVPLFPGGLSSVQSHPPSAFRSAGSVPLNWLPGTSLRLRGPLGSGFNIPQNIRHLALGAFGVSSAYLLPLLPPLLESGVDVALFSDLPPSFLPTAVEAHPLDSLAESLSWADFAAFAVSGRSLPGLREILGLAPHDRLAVQAQVLVLTPMPCGGLAECCVCALPTGRTYKLVCEDGPVFDLNELDW